MFLSPIQVLSENKELINYKGLKYKSKWHLNNNTNIVTMVVDISDLQNCLYLLPHDNQYLLCDNCVWKTIRFRDIDPPSTPPN